MARYGTYGYGTGSGGGMSHFEDELLFARRDQSLPNKSILMVVKCGMILVIAE